MSGTCCTTLVIHNYLIVTYIHIFFLRRFISQEKKKSGLTVPHEKSPERESFRSDTG